VGSPRSIRARLRPLALAGLTLVGLLLLLSGCGDSGEANEKPAGPPRLTQKQLVKRLGEICQEHTDQQVVARERFDRKHGIPSPEKATQAEYEQEIVQVILPIVRDTIHDVEQLRPPHGQEAKLEAFVKALKGAVATTQAHPEKLAAEAGEEPFYKARETAAALGAYFCGQA
jgi:hypothetical protein